MIASEAMLSNINERTSNFLKEQDRSEQEQLQIEKESSKNKLKWQKEIAYVSTIEAILTIAFGLIANNQGASMTSAFRYGLIFATPITAIIGCSLRNSRKEDFIFAAERANRLETKITEIAQKLSKITDAKETSQLEKAKNKYTSTLEGYKRAIHFSTIGRIVDGANQV